MAKSRYTQGPSDYQHRFHAGNLGDVLKHCVLIAWMRALQAIHDEGLRVVDTHAGAGMYPLPPKGEWEAGIGRLDALGHATAPPMIKAYLDIVGDRRVPNRGGLYPGSPAIVRGLLRDQDALTLAELAEGPHAKLAGFYANDDRVEVHAGDGLAKARALAESAAGPLAVFIDPPYGSKAEWSQVSNAVQAVLAARPDAAICVWYPIKSLMRPRTMASALRAHGAGASIDLISTPLQSTRKVLHGSGLLFVNPPAGLMATAAAEMAWLGEALAHPGEAEWSCILRGWHAPTTATATATEDAPY